MISLHGVYEDGRITILDRCPENIPTSTSVLLTFVSTQESLPEARGAKEESGSVEMNEEYYRSIREFERVDAHGNITIIDGDERFTYPLNDYSQGGLCFLSDRKFEIGGVISSGITDPTNPELVLMELKMEVRGIFQTGDDTYKVGCMFLDSVDEDLWHGLLQYLG
jgi:hypothetical protein